LPVKNRKRGGWSRNFNTVIAVILLVIPEFYGQ
jgi:hypothetical protein